jgi:Ca2+-binding RTX toxin-like protein
MIPRTRALVLITAAVAAASLATATDCFAAEQLPDPWSGTNAACVGRNPADNKTYIIWTRGLRDFHACITKEIGNDQTLYDDYEVRGKDGNDHLRIGCSIVCGRTTIELEEDIAWGGKYIDLHGEDGNDWLQSASASGTNFVFSWFFGGPGDDWLMSQSPIDRMIAGDGNDSLESLSSSATNEWLDGGDGDDCLRAHGTNIRLFDCGPGNDVYKTLAPQQNCETLSFEPACPVP